MVLLLMSHTSSSTAVWTIFQAVLLYIFQGSTSSMSSIISEVNGWISINFDFTFSSYASNLSLFTYHIVVVICSGIDLTQLPLILIGIVVFCSYCTSIHRCVDGEVEAVEWQVGLLEQIRRGRKSLLGELWHTRISAFTDFRFVLLFNQ